jgi:tetratricopeptide (TPR) repeat protein
LSRGQRELEKLIDADIARYPLGGEPSSDVQLQEQFWQQLRVPIQNSKLKTQNSKLRLATGGEPNVAMLLARGLTKPAEARTDDSALGWLTPGERAPGQELDIFEQMKMQLGPAPEGRETSDDGRVTSDELRPAPIVHRPSSEAAGGILDTYKSFAAYSNDKFNRHIRAAESYMKQGRFYRAADAYTLATIYKPQDPLGYGGKSIALFATGEYMSSSLFLARAMEVFPQYAKFRIDLVGLIGDKDTVENRILEAREWLDISKSAELEFLLSYVYYQMDRLEFARIAIESAAKKMPDSQAIAAMKKAIDERIAGTK